VAARRTSHRERPSHLDQFFAPYYASRVKDDTRVELLAIPVVAVIFGIGVLVLFAATEGPWAWILLGVGLVSVLALTLWRVTKRYPHMWDEAPADEGSPQHDDAV
jgi:cyanate permease